jgi:hypothetical protein
MREDAFRRHRRTYSFRAWIDEQGSNKDYEHEKWCATDVEFHCGSCSHLRMWDLNWNLNSHNIIRIVRRRHPLYLCVVVGCKYRTLLQIGRGQTA